MLERAASYVEPASQAFLQRVDAPLRSSRVLKTGFFRHTFTTNHAPSEPPLWWPQYLKAVRRVPQSSDRTVLKSRSRTVVPLGRRRSQSLAVGSAALKVLDSRSRRKTRSFSATSASRQAKDVLKEMGQDGSLSFKPDTGAAGLSEGEDPFAKPSFWGFDTGGQNLLDLRERFESGEQGSLEQEEALEEQQAPAEETSNLSKPGDAQTLRKINIEIQLEGLLDLADIDANDPAARQYDHVWKLFVALPQQELYASRVTHYLSTTKQDEHYIRALSAFELIPLEDRTKEDYNVLVHVAARRKKPALIVKACKEAHHRGLDELCRQTALLHLLKKGYWQNAAELWDVCWSGAGKMHRRAAVAALGYLHESRMSLLDNSPDLPRAVTELCDFLRTGPVIGFRKTQRTILHDAALNLSWRVVSSGHLMSMITPEGLIRVFDAMSLLGILKHEHLVAAIETLASKKRTERVRHDLAMVIYRNNKYRFPDQKIPSHVMHGLIYLCYRAEEKYEAFRYLLEDLRSRNTEDGQVLPTRSDYVGALRAMAWQGNAEAVERLSQQLLYSHGNYRQVNEIVPSLYVHAIVGNVAATQQMFDSLESQYQVVPDTICWNILMYAHVRSSDPQNAFQVFDDMLAANVEPDGYTFATIASVCARGGDVANVLSFVDSATQRGVKDFSVILATLTRAYLLNNEVEQAEELIANLSEFPFEGSTVAVWNELLKYHAYRSDVGAVQDVQQQMKAAGVEPDEYTYGAIMATLIRSGQTADALQLLRSLHFSGRVAATQFLYALILNGFLRERNYDMVTLIYNEICARFPAPSPSARLSKLKSEAGIDLERTREYYAKNATPSTAHRIDMKKALAFLETIEQDFTKDQSGRATKTAQPGFSLLPAIDAVPPIYTTTIAELLSVHGKPMQARGLLDFVQQQRSPDIVQRPESIRTLTSRMVVAREQMVWSKVDELWRDILQQGLKTSVSTMKLRDFLGRSQQSAAFFTSSATMPIEVMTHLHQRLQESGCSILPAQRFALALPLARYMISLKDQNRHEELIKVVGLFQALGYRLTGGNWNVYVQCLLASAKTEHRLAAFATFAEVQFPYMSTYDSMTRGLWTSPEDFVANTGHFRRPLPQTPLRVLGRVKPDVTPPSYVTIVLLASTILHFEQLAQQGDATLIEEVRTKYPSAYKRVLGLPQLTDSVQAVLLHKKRRHAGTRKAYEHTISQEGVLGSRSILDQLSLDRAMKVESELKIPKSRVNPTRSSTLEDIALAEEALGEIAREPIFREKDKRYETADEASKRVAMTMADYLERIDQLETMLKADSFIIGEHHGDPIHSPIWQMEDLEDGEALLESALQRAKTEDTEPTQTGLDELGKESSQSSSKTKSSRAVRRIKERKVSAEHSIESIAVEAAGKPHDAIDLHESTGTGARRAYSSVVAGKHSPTERGVVRSQPLRPFTGFAKLGNERHYSMSSTARHTGGDIGNHPAIFASHASLTSKSRAGLSSRSVAISSPRHNERAHPLYGWGPDSYSKAAKLRLMGVQVDQDQCSHSVGKRSASSSAYTTALSHDSEEIAGQSSSTSPQEATRSPEQVSTEHAHRNDTSSQVEGDRPSNSRYRRLVKEAPDRWTEVDLLAALRAEEASPGGVALHRVKSIRDLNGLPPFDKQAFLERKRAKLPGSNKEILQALRTLHKRLVPPPKPSQSWRKRPRPMSQYTLRRKTIAADRLARRNDEEVGKTKDRAQLFYNMDLPIHQAQEQMRAAEEQETSSRVDKIESLKRAQQERIQRRLIGGHSPGWRRPVTVHPLFDALSQSDSSPPPISSQGKGALDANPTHDGTLQKSPYAASSATYANDLGAEEGKEEREENDPIAARRV